MCSCSWITVRQACSSVPVSRNCKCHLSLPLIPNARLDSTCVVFLFLFSKGWNKACWSADTGRTTFLFQDQINKCAVFPPGGAGGGQSNPSSTDTDTADTYSIFSSFPLELSSHCSREKTSAFFHLILLIPVQRSRQHSLK